MWTQVLAMSLVLVAFPVDVVILVLLCMVVSRSWFSVLLGLWCLRFSWSRTLGGQVALTSVKREKFAKNKNTTSKERSSLSLYKVCYFISMSLIH